MVLKRAARENAGAQRARLWPHTKKRNVSSYSSMREILSPCTVDVLSALNKSGKAEEELRLARQRLGKARE